MMDQYIIHTGSQDCALAHRQNIARNDPSEARTGPILSRPNPDDVVYLSMNALRGMEARPSWYEKHHGKSKSRILWCISELTPDLDTIDIGYEMHSLKTSLS